MVYLTSFHAGKYIVLKIFWTLPQHVGRWAFLIHDFKANFKNRTHLYRLLFTEESIFTVGTLTDKRSNALYFFCEIICLGCMWISYI